MFRKYFGLTPVIPVLVSRVGEYDGRCGVKFPDAHYHIDEFGDVILYCRNAEKNEKQHRTRRTKR